MLAESLLRRDDIALLCVMSRSEARTSVTKMTVIKAAIFNLDGKLIDSNWVHLQSWRGALKILGLEFRDQEVIDRLGLRTVDIARQLLSCYGEHAIGKLVELKSHSDRRE